MVNLTVKEPGSGGGGGRGEVEIGGGAGSKKENSLVNRKGEAAGEPLRGTRGEYVYVKNHTKKIGKKSFSTKVHRGRGQGSQKVKLPVKKKSVSRDLAEVSRKKEKT